ncbi:hypothetical protein A1F99_126900 [Pyrenophora tritici-repentis]|nr:hypothetical protein A1F99_126900 [Pyrenophora tritici-repentis]
MLSILTAKRITFLYPLSTFSSTRAPAIGVPMSVATAASVKNAPIRAPIRSLGEICATAAGVTLIKMPEENP